jgi:hypothetical protein
MKIRSLIFACVALLCIAAISQAQEGTPVPLPAVQPAYPSSVIRVDGRFFLGILGTQDAGAYPHTSMVLPDAKLRFTYLYGKNLTMVSRLSFAQGNSPTGELVKFDYLYADVNNWGGLLHGQTIRAGRMKIDFGEETWTDNPEESNTISNSAGIVNGYDEGLDFRGPIVKGATPVIYSLSLINGSADVTKAVSAPTAVAKLGASPVKNLYVSGSYLKTGDLSGAAVTTDVALAGITAAPAAGTTNWTRQAWQVDLRYNYGPTGVQPEIPTKATAAVPFQLAGAYGKFDDKVIAGTGSNRDATYYYAEGLYNVTHKLYAVARYSKVGLAGTEVAGLAGSPVNVNEYKRTSFDLGYSVSPMAILKAEYSINNTDGGATEPKLNQVAVGLAMKF